MCHIFKFDFRLLLQLIIILAWKDDCIAFKLSLIQFVGFHKNDISSFGFYHTHSYCALIEAHFIYRKIPNICPRLIEVRKHFLVGLYSGGFHTGDLSSEGLLG